MIAEEISLGGVL